MEVLVFILARYLRPQDLCALSECCQIIRHRLLQTVHDHKRRHLAAVTLQRRSRGFMLPLPTTETDVLVLGDSETGKSLLQATFGYRFRQKIPVPEYIIGPYRRIYALIGTSFCPHETFKVFIEHTTSMCLPRQLLKRCRTILLCGSLMSDKLFWGLVLSPLYERFRQSKHFTTIVKMTRTLEVMSCYTIIELSAHNGGTWRLFDITRHPLLRAPNGHSLFPTNKIRDRKRLLAHGKL